MFLKESRLLHSNQFSPFLSPLLALIRSLSESRDSLAAKIVARKSQLDQSKNYSDSYKEVVSMIIFHYLIIHIGQIWGRSLGWNSARAD